MNCQWVTPASVMVILLPMLGSMGMPPARAMVTSGMARPVVPLGDRPVLPSSIAHLRDTTELHRAFYRDFHRDFHKNEQPSNTPSFRGASPTLVNSSKNSSELDRLNSNASEANPPAAHPPENAVTPDGDTTPVIYHILLETRGTLEMGDRIAYQDGSLYDEYEIDGTEGQQVQIHLESHEFDPYLVLIGPNGTILAQNDDVTPDNYNAFLELVLPSDGIYRVVANGFDHHSQGHYRLLVLTPQLDADSDAGSDNANNES